MRTLTACNPIEAHLPMDLYIDVTDEDCWNVLDRVGIDVPNRDVCGVLHVLLEREKSLFDIADLGALTLSEQVSCEFSPQKWGRSHCELRVMLLCHMPWRARATTSP